MLPTLLPETSLINRQILQNLGSGETLLAEVPCPKARGNSAVVQSLCSLVSLGTEKMLIDFGKGGLLAKARSQPDKVKQVLQKVKTDGLLTTLDAVKAKLDTPIPLGYCNVGKVIEPGPDSHFVAGQRIASNGPHAEQFSVSEHLSAAIPDGVTNDQAAFTVVGAIGLQGIRLLNPTLGERVVVSGLGLIGLLAVQMLRANGCQVLGIDFDPQKLKLARAFGAKVCDLSRGQDPVAVADQWTDGIGVDGVLITASTKSDELIHQAATMCRQRGRIVLVGVIGLNLQRADFYEKELSFQVSCSYGPGRYDPAYESRGLDYPIGFVRWTEQRNFAAVLELMAEGKLDVGPLITHRFAFHDALEGYKAIHEPGAMGILLEYDKPETVDQHPTEKVAANVVTATRVAVEVVEQEAKSTTQLRLASLGRDVGVAFIGAGGFSTRMLMPLLPQEGVRLRSVTSSKGVSAAYAGKKFGFEQVESSMQDVLSDDAVDAVFIATPHALHANQVVTALEAGKHVFVEKPLAMSIDDLHRVKNAVLAHPDQCLMVGFNRRFSPHTHAIKEWAAAAPSNKAVIITVNAGQIPADHWTQDRHVGGGRIVGEACHFIDLARAIVGASITHATGVPIRGGDGQLGDCLSIQLEFEEGSTASIHYLANGNKDFPKERVELFAGGKVYVCDNFRRSRVFGSRQRLKTRKQDKGHAAELEAFIEAIRNGGDWPIPLEELLEVSRVSIEMAALR